MDNNSTDGTAEVARRHGAEVVTERRPGYGSAVHAGVEAATTPIVAVVDADGSLDPAELPALVDELDRGADMAIGRRRPVPGLRWPWHARLGTAAVCWRLRTRYGLPVHDIAPMRVARRDALLALGITDRRTGYPRGADGACRAGGMDGRRTRCPLRAAHRRQVEGQRVAARKFHCGAGLLAGDLVIPVTLVVIAKAPVPARRRRGWRRRRRSGRRRHRRRGAPGHA